LVVMRHLPFESLLQLSATNKHFHDFYLCNKHIMMEALLNLEERPWNQLHEYGGPKSVLCCTDAWNSDYPCYGCLKSLPRDLFMDQDRYFWHSTDRPCHHRTACKYLRLCVTRAYSQHMKTATHLFRNQGADEDGGKQNESWVYCQKCDTVRLQRFNMICRAHNVYGMDLR
jgi:hypothetical protein